MNRQLIEKIALEVSGATPEDMHEETWIKWFATRFLSRIDAERGKEAAAWVRFTSDGGYEGPIMEGDLRIDLIRKTFWSPLFLSPTPTIPPGMVLVPVDHKKDAERYLWLRDRSVGPGQIWELLSDDCHPPILTLKSMDDLDSAIDKAMVQAAQGGK